MEKISRLNRVFVVGVGMTKFQVPGKGPDYPEMVEEAGKKALQDTGIDFKLVQQAVAGYCFGESTCGQKGIYKLGLTGIPIYNVNNNCSTGSTALMLGKQLVEGGVASCVLVVGFEKMEKGSLGIKYTDRANPLGDHVEAMMGCGDMTAAPITCQLFGNAGLEHMDKYGTKPEHFAKIAVKNSRHGVNNHNSQFQQERTVQEVMSSKPIHHFLTKLNCCPTSDGAACAILADESFVVSHGLQDKAVEILGQAMVTDGPSTFNDKSAMKIVGYDMSRKAGDLAYQAAGIRVDEVDVVELHDCFSTNELITYEALRLCPEGKAGEFIDKGDNTYGGKYVVNPSGGLMSKGHPLGATGVAQCAELCWQLRGLAGKRQVGGAKVGLQHNLGLGGAAVVTIYRHGFSKPTALSMKDTHKKSIFKTQAIFEAIKKEIEANGQKYVKTLKGVFCFHVMKGDEKEVWVIDVKNGEGSVKQDPNGSGDVLLTMDDEDLLQMMLGKLNPQQAFFKGKLKIKGNVGLATKLTLLMPKDFKAKL